MYKRQDIQKGRQTGRKMDRREGRQDCGYHRKALRQTASREEGRQADRKEGRRTNRQECMETERQAFADRQEGRQTGRKEDR